MRLRPGLGEKDGSRAGELATVTRVRSDGEVRLERNGEQLGDFGDYFKAADLAHGILDGWLPLHAAAALALDKAALLLVLEAHSAAAATADASGKNPFELLPSGASDDAATLLFEASGLLSRFAKDTPLWKLLAAAAEPEAEKPSAEAVRATLEKAGDVAAAARDALRIAESGAGDDATRAKLRIASELPRCSTSRMLKAFPMRPKLRKASVLPRFTKSRMLSVLPSRPRP
mgnify:CR=1 FL=1